MNVSQEYLNSLEQQLFTNVKGDNRELEEELKSLIKEQDKCIESALNTISDSVANKRKNTRNQSHEGFREDVHCDTNKRLRNPSINKDIDAGHNHSRNCTDASEYFDIDDTDVYDNVVKVKKEKDALRQLLLYNRNKIDPATLNAVREIEMNELLSVPSPMDATFTERALMSDINSKLTLKRFLNDSTNSATSISKPNSRPATATRRNLNDDVNVALAYR